MNRVPIHLSDFEESQVVDARGKTVGRVSRVLFHPCDPVLIGFEVRMKLLFYLFERKRRYTPLSGVRASSKAITLAEGTRLEKLGGRRAGLDWTQVVVWRGMPVRTASGAALGTVGDVDFDKDGRVTRLVLTRGATSDVAIGVREVPGDAVLGFEGDAVRLSDDVASPEFSGGLAAGAGKATAVAKVTAERAAAGAVSAAISAGRAVKRSSVAKRAATSWKGFSDGIREGMADNTHKENP